MSTTHPDSRIRTPEEIWRMLDRSIERQAEIERLLKETAAQLKETDQLITRQSAETDRRIRENDRRIGENDRLIRENDRLIRENDRRMKENDRRVRKALDLFTTNWGRLVESLVEGDLVKLLVERGVEVEDVSARHHLGKSPNGREVDLLATNGREVVAVEVKTTLRPTDVDRFLDLLAHSSMRRKARGRRLYGAVAYIHQHEGTDTYARRKGLFVIRATGSSASIVNPPEFQPHDFS